MLSRPALLADLQKLLQRLEADLLERSDSADVPHVGQALRAEYERAKKAARTAQNFEDWRSDAITQAAAAWVLSCVFVRFLEDNRLIDPPRISGPTRTQQSAVSGQSEQADNRQLTTGNSLQRARDEYELYFSRHPKETDREYLLAVFDELVRLPATREVFGAHNPIRELPTWLSGDAAGELLRFFQKINANTGTLIHDFADPPSPDGTGWDTRFLGDMYQDLSEAARKKYALLQTPEFVEEFILDRTLEPALDEFGLDGEGTIGFRNLDFRKEGALDFRSVDFGDNPTTTLLKPKIESLKPKTEDLKPKTESLKPKLESLKSKTESPNPTFKLIDPACGSGHFLLGAFRRILDRWQKREPGTNVRVLVQRALDSVYGVDVNPYAVAIARFRLLLAAMRACGIARLSDCPAFHVNLACGDSLLHAPLKSGQGVFDFELTNDDNECNHAYASEDLPALKRILRSGQYHAVVANPPYIVPKDRQLNERYRRRYETCHMKYSLAVPFIERIFRLTVPGGYTGQITANSFMKREFGAKLIELFFPKVDLTHVIDTSGGGGAHIPGHTTGTVILFGRNRNPVATTIRTVMGIRGDPSTPIDPAKGLVWTAILNQIDHPGSASEYVSAADSLRDLFHKHPWSIGGGGAAELKELLDARGAFCLSNITTSIGITSFTLADDFFFLPLNELRRRKLATSYMREMVVGDSIRDWLIIACEFVLFPYQSDFLPILPDPSHPVLVSLWPARTLLSNSKMFGGKTKVECGLKWYEYGRLTSHKLRTPLSITFANVATHNHFVLDRGGKIFECHAPIIKLASDCSQDEHLVILGILNSSSACFWMKQVFYPKATSTGDVSTEKGKPEANRYEFSGTGLERFPIPIALNSSGAELVRSIAAQLEAAASRLHAALPKALLSNLQRGDFNRIAAILQEGKLRYSTTRERMIALQEELDWEMYRAYGFCCEGACGRILNDDASGIPAEARPFEWETETAPKSVPETWRAKYEERRSLLRSIDEITVIEAAVFKRPWWGRQGVYGRLTRDYDSWAIEEMFEWLLNRLESYFDFDGRMKEGLGSSDLGLSSDAADGLESSVLGEQGLSSSVLGLSKNDKLQAQAQSTKPKDQSPKSQAQSADPKAQSPKSQDPSPLQIALTSVAKLADIARQDAEFQQVGELYRDDPAFDVQALVDELVAAESVPLLPVLRYKDSGLRKRAEWERTWELQRAEDEWQRDKEAKAQSGEEHTAPLPLCPSVPPKYTSADFLKSDYWRLRGKLDVPKERWVSLPHCAGPDGTLLIAWAGYDHLQLARAISAYYVDVQERLGGRDDPRLIPLLACLSELLPWLKQWHNDPDSAFDGMQMGDYFEGFIQDEARQLGRTLPEIKAWTPPAKTGGRGWRRAST